MKTLRIRSLVLAPLLLAGCPSSGGGDDGVSTDPVQDGFNDDDFQDDDGGLDGFGQPANPCVLLDISANHGHTVQEGNELQFEGFFELGGNAGHTHGIPVSEQQLDTLFSGGVVTVETTSNSLHTHKITAGVAAQCRDFDDDFDDGFEDGQIPPGIDDEG